jgi:hypothetical protein
MRVALCIGLVAACGSSPEPGGHDATLGTDASATADGPPGAHDASIDGDPSVIDGNPAVVDASVPDATPIGPDAFPGVLDVRINCRNDCVLIADPPSIAVPAGTEFEVNWINTGDTECDVAKIDEFNQVPIIIGLEPGTSYHDAVRQWCGSFTGTFDFRVSICTLHSYIPVDCDA